MTAAEIAVLPPEQFTREVWRLYRQALPDPTQPAHFNRLMREAGSQGMRYVEALLYAVEQDCFQGYDDVQTLTREQSVTSTGTF